MLILDAVTEMLPSTSEVETKDVGACVIRRATATPLAQVSLSPCVWRKRERRAREREREREKRERERERERERIYLEQKPRLRILSLSGDVELRRSLPFVQYERESGGRIVS
jgi:hypothetical protein